MATPWDDPAATWGDPVESWGGFGWVWDGTLGASTLTDPWDATLRGSYTPVAEARVWRNNTPVLRDGAPLHLMVTGGTVTVAESSKTRRTLTLGSADVDLDPESAADILAPEGTDLEVLAGVAYADGDVELVPVIWARLTEVTRRSVMDGLDLAGVDYSGVMAQARFLAPWNTPTGRLVFDEISLMVHDVDPTIECVDATDMVPAPKTRAAVWERDRWDAMDALASGIGCEVYFDATRRLIVRPVPQVTASTVPVWVVDAGTDTSVMLDVETGSDDAGYNAVVASSSASGAAGPPVTGIVYASTWKPGIKRPRFYASPLITTTAQALSAARKILARSMLWVRRVAPTTVPNPALDVGDPVLVVMPDGASEVRIVTDLQVPLGLGEMPMQTRVGFDTSEATDVGELS